MATDISSVILGPPLEPEAAALLSAPVCLCARVHDESTCLLTGFRNARLECWFCAPSSWFSATVAVLGARTWREASAEADNSLTSSFSNAVRKLVSAWTGDARRKDDARVALISMQPRGCIIEMRSVQKYSNNAVYVFFGACLRSSFFFFVCIVSRIVNIREE